MGEQLVQAAPQPKMRINHLDMKDVRAALADGLADFRRYPVFGLFFGGIYALAWPVHCRRAQPLSSALDDHSGRHGFPLIGPFVAVGLYEIRC